MPQKRSITPKQYLEYLDGMWDAKSAATALNC